MIKPRYKVFLEELPKNRNSIKASAIKAGYSKTYAHSNGRTLLKNAVKQSAKDLIESSDKNISASEAKKLMCEIIGMSSEQVFTTLKKIANQDKDYSSALKVLTPLSKQLGVDISAQEQSNVTVPVLNIGIVKTDEQILNTGDENMAQPSDIV